MFPRRLHVDRQESCYGTPTAALDNVEVTQWRANCRVSRQRKPNMSQPQPTTSVVLLFSNILLFFDIKCQSGHRNGTPQKQSSLHCSRISEEEVRGENERPGSRWLECMCQGLITYPI